MELQKMIDDLWDKVNSVGISNHSIKDISKAKILSWEKNAKVIIE